MRRMGLFAFLFASAILTLAQEGWSQGAPAGSSQVASGNGNIAAVPRGTHNYELNIIDLSKYSSGTLTISILVGNRTSAASFDLFSGTSVPVTGGVTPVIPGAYDRPPGSTSTLTYNFNFSGNQAHQLTLGAEGNWFSQPGSTNTYPYTATVINAVSTSAATSTKPAPPAAPAASPATPPSQQNAPPQSPSLFNGVFPATPANAQPGTGAAGTAVSTSTVSGSLPTSTTTSAAAVTPSAAPLGWSVSLTLSSAGVESTAILAAWLHGHLHATVHVCAAPVNQDNEACSDSCDLDDACELAIVGEGTSGVIVYGQGQSIAVVLTYRPGDRCHGPYTSIEEAMRLDSYGLEALNDTGLGQIEWGFVILRDPSYAMQKAGNGGYYDTPPVQSQSKNSVGTSQMSLQADYPRSMAQCPEHAAFPAVALVHTHPESEGKQNNNFTPQDFSQGILSKNAEVKFKKLDEDGKEHCLPAELTGLTSFEEIVMIYTGDRMLRTFKPKPPDCSFSNLEIDSMLLAPYGQKSNGYVERECVPPWAFAKQPVNPAALTVPVPEEQADYDKCKKDEEQKSVSTRSLAQCQATSLRAVAERRSVAAVEVVLTAVGRGMREAAARSRSSSNRRSSAMAAAGSQEALPASSDICCSLVSNACWMTVSTSERCNGDRRTSTTPRRMAVRYSSHSPL